MLDHVLGRPSVAVRKYQVLTAVLAWTLYILRGNRHGPPGIRRISSMLTHRVTAWQTVVLVGLAHYVLRNLGKLAGLECPEPLANLYEPAYFRATWATTALDAGFWTAMPIRKRWLGHLCSILFTGYYLLNAEQADEKVRAVRSIVTVEHLRNSWNKTLFNPILKFSTWLMRPNKMKYNPREIRIPRPHGSKYKDPVHGWLYFDGPISALKQQTKLILNIPGGGFVAMSPRTHDDSLMSWAAKTGLPILSLDYGKAPEHPYPYALHQCFDVYRQIILSCGRCAGIFSAQPPQVIISGDSAGGNLAAGTTLMILETGVGLSKRHPLSTPTATRRPPETLPPPAGLILIYPCLDVNIGNWMSDAQMELIRDKSSRRTNHRVLRRKRSVFMRTAGTPYASDASSSPSRSPSPSRTTSEDEDDLPHPALNLFRPKSNASDDTITPKTRIFKTPIAVPSMISYFSDRILTPEMMRAMIILYIGQRAKPDFSSDYYLSPVLAPDELLERFPRTYFLTGERDPLVDDTCIMAGRIRRAKRDAATVGRHVEHDEDSVRVELIPGVSHGFIQMAPLYPKAWSFIDMLGGWYEELFSLADEDRLRELWWSHAHAVRTPATPKAREEIEADLRPSPPRRRSERGERVSPPLEEGALRKHDEMNGDGEAGGKHHHRRRTAGTTTSEESDPGLEMKMKPLTTSLHGNGTARKPARRKSSGTSKSPEKDEVRKRRSSETVRAHGSDETVKPAPDQSSSDDEREEPTQSPFARGHPTRKGSAWSLNRKNRLNLEPTETNFEQR